MAVLTVLAGHFLPTRTSSLVGFGDSGVVIFFCLSGFLITSILLESLKTSGGPVSYLRRFFVRRALRIFPIYYLSIATCVVVGYEPVIDNFWRLATYTANFIPGLPMPAPLQAASHLWSLSVEEQFYWVWPLVVLLLHRRALLSVVLAVAIVGLGKYILIILAPENRDLYGLLFRSLPSCLDSLGAGAALAIVRLRRADVGGNDAKPVFSRNLAFAAALLFFGLTAYRAVVAIDPWYSGHWMFGVLYFQSVIFISVVAIDFATSRPPPWFRKFFETRFMIFTGRISYGMYVYHFFLLAPSTHWFPPTLAGKMMTLPLLLAAVYLMASASFFLVERPLLRLKDKIS